MRWRRMQYAVLEEIADRLPWVPDLLHVNSHETLVLGSMIALEYDIPLVASLHEQKPDLLAFGRGRCKLAYSTLPVDAYLAGSAFYHRRAVAFGAPRGPPVPDLPRRGTAGPVTAGWRAWPQALRHRRGRPAGRLRSAPGPA